MPYNPLLFWTPGPIEVLVVLVLGIIPAVVIVKLVRYFQRNRSENIRLRLEVGKLADELEQSRKRAEDNANDQPQADST
jgi:hypothetical protein